MEHNAEKKQKTKKSLALGTRPIIINTKYLFHPGRGQRLDPRIADVTYLFFSFISYIVVQSPWGRKRKRNRKEEVTHLGVIHHRTCGTS